MAGKRKNIYLYLALACFIGIILIFVFDGYMGLYDTATIISGEIPIKYMPEQWQDQERFGYSPSISINYGEKGYFSYELDNRQFSAYNTEIDVSLWRNQEKVADILNENINIKAFSKGQIDWVFDTKQYIPGGIPENTSTDYTVLIKHGDTERKLLIYVFNNPNSGMKVIIPPNAMK